jgi:hypothetical protein
VRAQKPRCALECFALTNNNLFDSKLHCRAGAQKAWHERAVKHGPTVIFNPSRAAQALYLGMGCGVAALHSPVVPPSNNPAALHENAADRDAALPRPLPRLFNRRLHEPVHKNRIRIRVRLNKNFLGKSGESALSSQYRA